MSSGNISLQEQKKVSIGIENLRVLAILAIVKHHSFLGYTVWNSKFSLAYMFVAELTNYGTILFMIISGYLFEKNLYKYSSIKKLINKKIQTLLLPCLPFAFIWYLLEFVYIPLFGSHHYQVTFSAQYFLKNAFSVIFFSNYWFIFNLILVQIVNCLIGDMRRYNYLFSLSVLITIFYSVNIYTHWLPTSNSSALLAYFCFFFMGRLGAIHYQKVTGFLHTIFSNKIYLSTYVCLTILCFCLAVAEIYYIQTFVSDADPTNILRISNIVFSLLLIAILFLIRHRFALTRYFKQKFVFLIFLMNPILELPSAKIADKLHLDVVHHDMNYLLPDIIYAIFTILISVGASILLLKNSYFKALMEGRLFQRREIKRSKNIRETAIS